MSLSQVGHNRVVYKFGEFIVVRNMNTNALKHKFEKNCIETRVETGEPEISVVAMNFHYNTTLYY